MNADQGGCLDSGESGGPGPDSGAASLSAICLSHWCHCLVGVTVGLLCKLRLVPQSGGTQGKPGCTGDIAVNHDIICTISQGACRLGRGRRGTRPAATQCSDAFGKYICYHVSAGADSDRKGWGLGLTGPGPAANPGRAPSSASFLDSFGCTALVGSLGFKGWQPGVIP